MFETRAHWMLGVGCSMFPQLKMKPTILILCTGNSCRSHMAEGMLRAEAGDLVNVQSAGSKPAGYVHPLAIKVMTEVGIDISGHRSKPLSEFLEQHVNTVITVCSNADAVCPIFPGQLNRHHWPFEDPALVLDAGKERLHAFRKLRDKIHARVIVFVAESARGYLW